MQNEVTTAQLAKFLDEGPDERYRRAIQLMRGARDLPIETAVRLAKAAASCDPSFGPLLARYIADNGTDMPVPESRRVRGILDRTEPDTARVRMTLASILSASSDVHIRSKITLMLGRSHISTSWLRQQLRSGDSRVRANAIESLPIHNTPELLNLLRGAAADLNNRVAGNALLALYRLGDRQCLETIRTMASHASPEFRATAAWVMAEIADPCFLESLKTMVSRDHGRPRLHAIRALTRLKTACAGPATDQLGAA